MISNKMIFKSILFVCLVFMGLSCSTSGYDLLLEKTFDHEQKARLEDFANAGIENCWPFKFEKKHIIQSALKYKGVKYQSGGTTSKGLDCSGLVYLSAKDIGLKLPHHAQEMARFGQVVPTRGRLRKGDFVFFKGEGKRLINHVGIMLSHTEFLHVSSSKGCIVSKLKETYWADRFLFGTR